jgi:hypothetical protein
MPIPTSIADISTTAASNYPAGGDAIGTSLDDYLRTIQSIIKQQDSKGSDIASSTTITVPNAGSYFVVTGTTTIATIADNWNGRQIALKFSGILQLTHSSGLILPGSANITTAAGDCLLAVNESTGVWRIVAFQPAAGFAKAGANADITGLSAIAAGSAALPSITPSGDTNTGVWFPAADTFAVSTGGAERMRIGAQGDIASSINNAVTTQQIALQVTNTSAAASGTATQYGCLVSSSATTGNGGTNGLIAGRFASSQGVAGINTANQNAIQAVVSSAGAGTLASCTGLSIQGTFNAASTVTSYNGVVVSAATGAVPANSIAFYHNINSGSGQYGFYGGGTAPNLFNGDVLVIAGTATLGYGTGAGGTVTQATSKATVVTLNKPCGQITMNNAALAAATAVSFQLTNSLCTQTDTMTVANITNQSYRVELLRIGTGFAIIQVTNITGGSLSEAIVINFNLHKGANS